MFQRFPGKSVACAALIVLVAPALADGRADLDRALEALDKGELKAAVESAEKVGEGDPWRADAQFCAGYCYAVAKNHEKSAAAYREVVRLRPGDARAWNNLGIELDDLGKIAEAVNAYDQAIGADPRWAVAWNNKGVSLDRMGEGEKAAEMFERAIEIDPEYAAPHNNLGAWYYEQGDKRAAARSWTRAAVIDPSYVSPIVNSSVLDYEGNKAIVAEKKLRALVAEGKATADVWYNLGVYAFKRGDFETALAAMGAADQLRPDHPETLNNLAVLHSQKGNYRRAETLLLDCTKIKPDMVKAWDNLGLVYYREKRFEDARKAFEKEVELDPQSGYGQYNLGCALAAENKMVEAQAAFEKAVEVSPGHIEALHNLALLSGRSQTRDPAKELDLYLQVLRNDPDYAPAHLSLGRFYQTEPKFRDLKKALAHYQRYVSLEKTDLDSINEVRRTIAALRKKQ